VGNSSDRAWACKDLLFFVSSEAVVTSISPVNANALFAAQERIQQDLKLALDAFSLAEPLKSAVYHAVMLGGKRVRPALCYAAASLNQHSNFAAARRCGCGGVYSLLLIGA
jgi:hypothetical protein